MFTGLITHVGQLLSLEDRGDRRLVLKSAYDMETVAMGASIACNGICLTVVDKGNGWFAVDASAETMRVTTLGDWAEGVSVNMERSLKLGDEMGGHIVSGHVDCVGKVLCVQNEGASMCVTFAVGRPFASLLVEKGSVAVDGVSLTVNKVQDTELECLFTVNIIPHTQKNTSFHKLRVGQSVNIEFDLLARYVARLRESI